MKTPAYFFELFQMLRAARGQSGKAVHAQLMEMLALRSKPTKLSVSDYFKYRLYFDAPFKEAPKEDFIGWRLQNKLDASLNDPKYQVLARDKLVTYALLAHSGLPIPDVYAIYERGGRIWASASTLRTSGELLTYLRETNQYPCFVKPVYGDIGRGAMSIDRYEPGRDCIILATGEEVPVRELPKMFEQKKTWMEAKRGYILQELVVQHPEVAAVCRAVATVRIVVIMTEEGPQPIRAVWRVAREGRMTDNFDSGKSGNLLAAVNLDSGRIDRVVAGAGLEAKDIQKHPDSGIQLVGFKLPYWPEALDLVSRGARVFPMAHWQHWDVALGANGPLVLEMNMLGAVDVAQIAAGRGLYTEEVRELATRQAQSH